MALSDILGGISGAANGLGNALFPTDPSQADYIDPNVATNNRNQALIRLGLGIMRAPYSMTGTASGVLDALNGADQSYQGAMDRAFTHTVAKRQLENQAADRDFLQQERAIQLKSGQLGLKQAERSDRTQAATVAQRVLKGLAAAPDKQGYLNLIQNEPDVKDAFSTLGIQPPYAGPMAAPGNIDQFTQQLGTAAAAAPAPTPIKLSQGDVLLNPNDPSQVLASAAPKSTTEYKDAGDKLIPVNSVTGQVVPGLAPIPKSLTAYQQKQVEGQTLTPDAIDLAARRLKNGEAAGTVLANFGRGAQGAANIAAVQNRFAQLAATPDDNGNIMGAEDIAARVQELGAQKRTLLELGAREGKIAPRVQEAKRFAELALQASDEVPRSDWKGGNNVLQWVQDQASGKELGRFQAANVSLINAYAAAIGGGTIHKHDQEVGAQLLSTANGPENYKAKVQQLITETETALKAPKEVMAQIHKENTGKDIPTPKGADSTVTQVVKAPAAAVNFLLSHPEAKDAFKAKYGYLPGGF